MCKQEGLLLKDEWLGVPAEWIHDDILVTVSCKNELFLNKHDMFDLQSFCCLSSQTQKQIVTIIVANLNMGNIRKV